MIDFFFFFFCAFFLVFNHHLIKRKRLNEVTTNPFILFSLFFGVIHLALPFLQWNEGFFRYQNGYNELTYILSFFYVLITYLIVFTSYKFSGAGQIEKTSKFISNKNAWLVEGSSNKKIFFLSIVIYIIGGYFAYQNFSLISLLGNDDYLRDRISFGVGRGANVLLAHWMYVSTILFFFLLIKKNLSKYLRRFVFLFFLFSLSSVIVYYGLNSNRNSLFILIINLIAIYYAINGSSKINFSSTIKLGVIAIFCLFIFKKLGENRIKNRFQAVSSKEYSISKTLNGAFGNHENIVWLIENNSRTKLHYGSTYLAGLTNFVPRAIWPEKPVGAGPYLKNTIYPGSYVVGRSGNSSLTTGLITELHMNFGFFGALFGAIIYGFTLKRINISLFKVRRGINFVIMMYLLVAFSTMFVYSEFLGFFSRLIVTMIPLIFIKHLTK